MVEENKEVPRLERNKQKKPNSVQSLQAFALQNKLRVVQRLKTIVSHLSKLSNLLDTLEEPESGKA